MIHRSQISELTEILSQFPALVILGSRQVGKTTLVNQLSSISDKPIVYFDLEFESHFNRLSQDPEAYLVKNQDCLVVIDEVQRMPRLFALLRALIDMHRVPGRFLLTGSASPHLIKGVSESLAGRVAYFDLGGLNLMEALSDNISQNVHWFRGGYPEALTAKSDAIMRRWRNYFIKSYIEKELNNIYDIEFTQDLTRRFWKMLAHTNGELYNAGMYSRSLGVTGPTVTRYLNYMDGAFLVFRLLPWFSNAKKRLVKSQKIYIRDTGILHGLLGINTYDDLLSHPVVGSSWEGYVIEQVRQFLPDGIDMYFYRTQHGAECDLVLVRSMKPVAAIEIKLSTSPQVSRGFYECIDDLETSNNYLIMPSGESFPAKNNVWCYGLKEFLVSILPNL